MLAFAISTDPNLISEWIWEYSSHYYNTFSTFFLIPSFLSYDKYQSVTWTTQEDIVVCQLTDTILRSTRGYWTGPDDDNNNIKCINN